jgi:GNAT superfamily N-acetyltransferase
LSDRIPLVGEYTSARIDPSEFRKVFADLRSRVFTSTFSYDPSHIWSEEESAGVARLRERMASVLEVVLGAYHGTELIGWTFGRQEDPATFVMINSGVLPEHQHRGIYKALLPRMLEIARTEGFQVVRSYHCATNNSIIVPKLRAGFILSGFDISDRFGLIVRLEYHFNPTRRRIMDVRSGQERPDDEIKRILGL